MASKAVSLVLTVLLMLQFPVSAYAAAHEDITQVDASQAEAAEDISEDIGWHDLPKTYNAETGMFIYTLGNAEFWSSEEFAYDGISTQALWIGTDSPDISIRITLDGELFAYSPATIIDMPGSYVIEISNISADSTEQSVTYNAEITDAAQFPSGGGLSNSEGRLELTPDGDSFSYDFGGYALIKTNVLDGETISYPAKLEIPDGLYCSITRDGSIYSLPHNGIISENGAYSLNISILKPDGSTEKRHFGFCVYMGESSRLGIYHPPFGYEIIEVMYEGQPYEFDGSFCHFTQDGEYKVSYRNGDTERTAVLLRDTTAPVIFFNDGSNMVFDEAVTITTDSPCTITVEKNGMPAGSSPNLKGTGIYRVTAVDSAGNSTTARIEITAVSAFNPMNFVIIGVIVIIAATVYFIILKNSKLVVR